jgi:hypothetical protein
LRFFGQEGNRAVAGEEAYRCDLTGIREGEQVLVGAEVE